MAYYGGPEQVIQPHGRDRSLLDQQEFHRSQHIWSIGEGKTLRCQRASQFKAYGEIDARILGLLDRAGFGAVARVGCLTIDQHLITGLVERWRPETHTFHFTVGEATITLQDVEVIMGLKVDGFPVTCGRLDTVNWKALCYELLGVEPDDKYIKGGRLSLTWLRGQFFGEERLREYATVDEIRQHTRAFILSMCGGLLFGDKTANSVHVMFLPLLADLEGEDGTRKYAWGAALLACMYRELCKASYADDDQIAGCLQLVQIWAYERIPILRPQLRNLNLQIPHDCPVSGRWKFLKDLTNVPSHNVRLIRFALDNQREEEMIWEPYVNLMQVLPDYCREGQSVWRAVVPLICGYMVEYHQPDRCLRQFGMNQPIPEKPSYIDCHHKVDLRKQKCNWEKKHELAIAFWGERRNNNMIATSPQIEGRLHSQSQYMQWYRNNTRLWLSPSGAARPAVADGLQNLYHTENSTTEMVRAMAASMLVGLDEQQRLTNTYPPQHAPQPMNLSRMPRPTGEVQRRRGRHERIPDPPPPVGFQQIPSQRLYDLYSQGGENVGPGPTNEGVQEEFVHVVTQPEYVTVTQPEYVTVTQPEYVTDHHPVVHESPQGSGSRAHSRSQRSGSHHSRSQHAGSQSHESRQRSRSRSGMMNEVVQTEIYNPNVEMGETSSQCFNTPQQNIMSGFRNFNFDTNLWSGEVGGSSTINQPVMLHNFCPSDDVGSSFVSTLQGENLFGSHVNDERECGCTEDYRNANPQRLRRSLRNNHSYICTLCNGSVRI